MKKIIYKKDIKEKVMPFLDRVDAVYLDENDYLVMATRKDDEIEIVIQPFSDDIVFM